MTEERHENLKTVIVRMSDGKRIPILEDSSTGLPVVGDNVWLVTKRAPKRSVETMLGDISVLSIVRSWAKQNSVPLAYRFRAELFLSETEITSLVSRLRERKRPLHGGRAQAISAQKWRSRFDTTSTFFRHLAETHAANSCEYVANAPFSNFMVAWTAYRPRGSSRARVGLTAKQIAVVLRVTEPGHPENPWHRRTQVRNRLIVLLMLICGLRLGEVLSLRMEDLQVRGAFPTIDVKKRAFGPDEHRRIPPTPKTLGRRMPLTGKVADALNQYLLNDRLNAPGASRQGFLVLTREGQPCSKEAVHSAIRVLRASNAELSGLVAHRFRNSFADMAQEALKRTSALNSQQKADILVYMGGWSKTSKQPSRYSEAWLSEQVEHAIQSMHDSFFGTLS